MELEDLRFGRHGSAAVSKPAVDRMAPTGWEIGVMKL